PFVASVRTNHGERFTLPVAASDRLDSWLRMDKVCGSRQVFESQNSESTRRRPPAGIGRDRAYNDPVRVRVPVGQREQSPTLLAGRRPISSYGPMVRPPPGPRSGSGTPMHMRPDARERGPIGVEEMPIAEERLRYAEPASWRRRSTSSGCAYQSSRPAQRLNGQSCF